MRRYQFQHSNRRHRQPTSADLLDRALHQHDPLDRPQRRGDEPGDELAEIRSREQRQSESLDDLLLVLAPCLIKARVLIPERRRGFQLRRHHREKCLDAEHVHARFTDRLARQQAKDLAHDYLERAVGAGERAVAEVVPAPAAEKTIEATPAMPTPTATPTLEEIRAAAREEWGQYRERALADGAPQTLEGVRRQAREDWGKLRAETVPERAPAPTAAQSLVPGMELEPDAPGTPPKPSTAGESEPIVAEGRAAKPEVAQALEREPLQAQERDAQLKKQRAALERWRARGRGSSPNPLKERSGEVFEGAIEKAQGPAAQPGPKPAPVIEVVPVVEPASPTPVFETSDQVRAAAREDWREERAGALGSWQAPNLADLRRQGLEEWLAMRAQVQARGGDLSAEQIQAQGRAAWKALRGLEGETAQDLKEEARERERLGALSARELWAQIERIKPLPVERLVELDPAVAGVRRVVETHQFAAQDALHAASRAAHESQWWRRERGLQAKLHDLGVRKAEYLLEREAAQAQAKDARAEALKASALAQARLLEARSDAERRITQETAPARAKVAELERLAAAAYERERVVQEFERLARGRAAGREEFRDTGESWQATPPKLRQMIDRYNQEPAQVQEAILKKYSTTAALAQSCKRRCGPPRSGARASSRRSGGNGKHSRRRRRGGRRTRSRPSCMIWGWRVRTFW